MVWTYSFRFLIGEDAGLSTSREITVNFERVPGTSLVGINPVFTWMREEKGRKDQGRGHSSNLLTWHVSSLMDYYLYVIFLRTGHVLVPAKEDFSSHILAFRTEHFSWKSCPMKSSPTLHIPSPPATFPTDSPDHSSSSPHFCVQLENPPSSPHSLSPGTHRLGNQGGRAAGPCRSLLGCAECPRDASSAQFPVSRNSGSRRSPPCRRHSPCSCRRSRRPAAGWHRCSSWSSWKPGWAGAG